MEKSLYPYVKYIAILTYAIMLYGYLNFTINSIDNMFLKVLSYIPAIMFIQKAYYLIFQTYEEFDELNKVREKYKPRKK